MNPTGQQAELTVRPPKGWKLLKGRHVIREGDLYIGALDYWQPVNESAGYTVSYTGFRAVIRKIKKRPASRNEY